MAKPTINGKLGFFFDGGTGNRWIHDGDDWVPYTTSGTTAARPITPPVGQQYFDTTLIKPIWYTGAKWVLADGTDA